MTHQDVELVNSRRIRPPARKMVLVALADYRNGKDGRCFPSIAKVADMAGLGERQTIRLLQSLIAEGLVSSTPGRDGASTRYALNFAAIRALPIVRGREYLADEAAASDRVSPVTGGSVLDDTPPLSPVSHESGIQSVRNTGVPTRKLAGPSALAAQGGKSKRVLTKALTCSQWIEAIKAAGEFAIPAGDPIFDYCDDVGIAPEMFDVAWAKFKRVFTTGEGKSKRCTDWPERFREDYVRENKGRLWFIERAGTAAKWTTAGLQAHADLRATAAKVADAPPATTINTGPSMTEKPADAPPTTFSGPGGHSPNPVVEARVAPNPSAPLSGVQAFARLRAELRAAQQIEARPHDHLLGA